ncbi:exonuclease subunit SbcD [Leisingera sp. HS039]|uniref:exonuclease subunit SbcD n=1 Tax=Leisingera sp. HS039 TaxID=2818496 RepID=UPI001B39FC98|nr:exonuclease subunit SbcD [Leisingera sp. HS039]MBQ4826908.1 exonuclease subunit SbcD [Leisingera sp. HS039]
MMKMVMRILHTADLHLGHSLNGWDREAEHRTWFDNLAEIVVQEEIDLVLVAGDIYDNTNPSGEIQQLFYHGLTEMKRRRPGLKIVISGGNHDPARRLEAPRTLMAPLDMHVVGAVHRIRVSETGELVIDIDKHLVPIMKDGQVACHVLSIPFLRASDLPGLNFGDDENHEIKSPVVRAATRFFEEITQAALVRIGKTAPGTPLIATSHLHCAGGAESEGAERRIMIGGSHALPPEVFPGAISYVALGHLHQPQTLGGGRVRYCGSCFPLSSSEISYNHGVTIVEIQDEKVKHRHISIPRPAPVLRLPRGGSAPAALELEELEPELIWLKEEMPWDEDTPMGLRPLVYLEMKATDAASVIMTNAAGIVKAHGLRLAGIRVRREALPGEKAVATTVVKSLRDTIPETLFAESYIRKNGIAPEERHLAAFREASQLTE